MNVDKLIMDTLSPLGYPIAKARYIRPEKTYIVFVEYNQGPRINADDDELLTKHFYQVDIFSDVNYNELVKSVKKLMKQAGFGRMFESETYDDDMGKYRKIIRFNYEPYIGEEY